MTNEVPEWADDEQDTGSEPIEQVTLDTTDDVTDDELDEVERTTVVDPKIEGEAGVQ